MQASFWHSKWDKGEIGFHLDQANPLLLKHFDSLALTKGQTIFVPLCGKTKDIAWLLAQGLNVVAVELNKTAVEALFSELNVTAQITQLDELNLYKAKQLSVFQGDFFNLSSELIGKIDAVYDRAALIALPIEMRIKYTQQIMQLTNKVKQLIICVEYQQAEMQGPPFAIHAEDISAYYAKSYQLNLLESIKVEGGLKGKLAANESIWLLS
ncbi:thiopurine S-methyltransferase [Catenovulum maritimum]|uniref:Thiopurine S-methyltransferase n=1 Tax=Catenovulum maritimum TaxID=1513271 RepID=A0A0J8GZ71_9ALTE|nr:thiopurine S-methyltransferase [Catenovulum maritimum]KMT66013.1 thiopurine S-methyltransferase [Catenovulum maritimum]